MNFDLTASYLRFFLGARGFRSSELDDLAKAMNVDHLLSQNPGNRYFRVGGRLTALSLANKVIVGERYYDNLREENRLAVVAHEFGHMLQRRHGDLGKTISKAGVLAVAATMLSIGIAPPLVSVVLGLCSFVVFVEYSLRLAARRQSEVEMQCDKIAVSFVGIDALAEALVAADSYAKSGSESGRETDSSSSAIERRIIAIRNLGTPSAVR